MEETFSLKQRINQFAQSKHITLESVCTRSDVGIYVITNGNPSWDKLVRICRAFPELSSEYILRGEGSAVRPVPQDADLTHSADKFNARLSAYLRLSKTTQANFVELTHISAEIFKNRPGKEVNPSYTTLQKICDVYPNLSAEYLLRGEGTPIRILDSTDDDQFSDTFPSLVNEYINSRKLSADGPTLADLLITSMQETIRTQRELIDSLRAQLSLRNELGNIQTTAALTATAPNASESDPDLFTDIIPDTDDAHATESGTDIAPDSRPEGTLITPDVTASHND